MHVLQQQQQQEVFAYSMETKKKRKRVSIPSKAKKCVRITIESRGIKKQAYILPQKQRNEYVLLRIRKEISI